MIKRCLTPLLPEHMPFKGKAGIGQRIYNGFERRAAAHRVGGEIPPKSEVQSELRQNLPIVLDIGKEVDLTETARTIVIRRGRCIAVVEIRRAKEEIGKGEECKVAAVVLTLFEDALNSGDRGPGGDAVRRREQPQYSACRGSGTSRARAPHLSGCLLSRCAQN